MFTKQPKNKEGVGRHRRSLFIQMVQFGILDWVREKKAHSRIRRKRSLMKPLENQVTKQGISLSDFKDEELVALLGRKIYIFP